MLRQFVALRQEEAEEEDGCPCPEGEGCPCPEQMEQILDSGKREVLIAIDSSKGAELAFQWALDNYCKPADHIRLIHARKSFAELAGRLPDETVQQLESQAQAAAMELMQKYMKKCAEVDLDCDWKISTGDEREAICKEVLRTCADVLIIGTRGLSPVRKALLGSVSEYCAHHSACPVIIVKDKSIL